MMQASVPLLRIQTDEIHLKQAENTNLVLSSFRPRGRVKRGKIEKEIISALTPEEGNRLNLVDCIFNSADVCVFQKLVPFEPTKE